MGKRYDKTEKRLIKKTIKEMGPNHSYEEIATKLGTLGVKKTSGDPLDATAVSNQAQLLGLGKRRRRRQPRAASTAVTPTWTAQTGDRRALLELVIDSRLSKDAKIAMITHLI